MRILIYAINGKGMGHLNRTTILARGAQAADPSADIRFLAGSPLFGMVADAGFEVVKVPDRHHGLGFFSGMNGRPSYVARHFDLLLEHYQPDVLVTDFAINAALFASARRRGARIAVVLRKQRPFDLHRLVLTPSARLVDRFLLPHSTHEWPLRQVPGAFRGRARHLGAVVRSLDPKRVQEVRARYAAADERLVVVTIGGGGYSEAWPLLDVAATAAKDFPRDASGRVVRWLLVYGPYYPHDVPASDAGADTVQRIRYEPFLPELMRSADVVVCNAGYNTVNEVQVSTTPVVVVPRLTRGRDDQVERAQQLVASGRALLARDESSSIARAVRSVIDEQTVPRTQVADTSDPRILGETFLKALDDSWSGPHRAPKVDGDERP